jgi:hypothetical protein
MGTKKPGNKFAQKSKNGKKGKFSVDRKSQDLIDSYLSLDNESSSDKEKVFTSFIVP